MKRHSLSLRQKTTISQAVPFDVIPKLVNFVLHLRSLQIRHKYPTDSIFAMDKTACWMDMSSDTTVAHTHSHSIRLKTTGHENDNFTMMLTEKANGTKLKPFVIFKGKGTRLIKTLLQIPGVVKFSSNGWMNDSTPLTTYTQFSAPFHSPSVYLFGMLIVATLVCQLEKIRLNCGSTLLLYQEGV